MIARDKSIKEQDIINSCRKALPPYKVPQKVTFLKELPVNAFGKVQKFRLLESTGNRVWDGGSA